MNAPEDTSVIPADPVLDGQLLDDDPSAGQQRPSGRVASWWQRSPRVPTAVKSTHDGTSRQARGYLLADIRAAITALQDDPEPDDELA